MKKILILALILSIALLLFAPSTPVEAQTTCDCQSCRTIGFMFPIHICWPEWTCGGTGQCTCIEVGNTCNLTGYYCFIDCIYVY